ncbi:hypothetical protein [Acinetobacter sp. SA01]|jgi:predicted YcjX-like family ATPase|uniref:hypothetical protein n=1 Tax=Acinetobacter sp. SA01 TaxID=1862567 RepID=UPI0014079362|nr:hypothetical protein [Acinetobacter sp. SA01]
MIEVILPDNSIANTVDVMQQLIESAVQNAIENPDGLNLRSKAGIQATAELIVDYLEISTGEKFDVQAVITELKRQLR